MTTTEKLEGAATAKAAGNAAYKAKDFGLAAREYREALSFVDNLGDETGPDCRCPPAPQPPRARGIEGDKEIPWRLRT